VQIWLTILPESASPGLCGARPTPCTVLKFSLLARRADADWVRSLIRVTFTTVRPTPRRWSDPKQQGRGDESPDHAASAAGQLAPPANRCPWKVRFWIYPRPRAPPACARPVPGGCEETHASRAPTWKRWRRTVQHALVSILCTRPYSTQGDHTDVIQQQTLDNDPGVSGRPVLRAPPDCAIR
jgi:hypothetical protein